MNRKGQAVIEYILLLVVLVGLFGLAYNRLFKPFQAYFSGVGDYVGCLLEYGELPSFGSSGGAQDKQNANGKSCKAQFQASGSGGSGSGGSSGANGENGSSSSEEDKAAADAANVKNKNKNGIGKNGDSDSAGGSGSGRVYSSSSGLFKSNQRTIQRPIRGADGGSADDPKMSSFRRSSAGASDPYGLSRPKRISVANEYTSYIRNKEKNSKSAKAPKETLASLDGANPSGGPKKFIVKPPIRNIAEEVEEEPFSISGLMRYFIIAAIIILILVLVGGQALQMSKNMEK